MPCSDYTIFLFVTSLCHAILIPKFLSCWGQEARCFRTNHHLLSLTMSARRRNQRLNSVNKSVNKKCLPKWTVSLILIPVLSRLLKHNIFLSTCQSFSWDVMKRCRRGGVHYNPLFEIKHSILTLRYHYAHCRPHQTDRGEVGPKLCSLNPALVYNSKVKFF